MALKTKYTELVERLWESDADSALTNEAARAIEELVMEMLCVRATFDMMIDDASDMNRIGAGVSEARLRRLLQIEETEE